MKKTHSSHSSRWIKSNQNARRCRKLVKHWKRVCTIQMAMFLRSNCRGESNVEKLKLFLVWRTLVGCENTNGVFLRFYSKIFVFLRWICRIRMDVVKIYLWKIAYFYLQINNASQYLKTNSMQNNKRKINLVEIFGGRHLWTAFVF